MSKETARPIIGILLLVELALMLLFAYGYYRWTIEWRVNGPRTTAEIVDKHQNPEGTGYVTYRYSVADVDYSREHPVTAAYYDKAAVGQKIEITYSPVDVSVSGINGQGIGDFGLPRLPGTFFDLKFLVFTLPILIVANLIAILGLWFRSRRSQAATTIQTQPET